jgi:UDP-N-acetylmuramyl tripeptide synthase
MDPRLSLAVGVSRLSATAIRRLGQGGGTALPGLLATLIDPGALSKLSRQVPGGCVVVAGTNGKTTTTRMLATVLRQAGQDVVHNRTGSNLVRGITAALAEQASLLGRVRGDVAVIEVDEAAFAGVVQQTNPRVVLLLNLFRDQLDRYGELDTIARAWRETLRALPSESRVVVNVDDPTLAVLTEEVARQRLAFGLAEARLTLERLPHAADASVCRRCDTPLTYRAVFLAHLGDYRCPRCGFARPPLDVAARSLVLDGLERSSFEVLAAGQAPWEVDIALPGLYNVYNALAAVAAALELGVPPTVIRDGLAATRAAFGRLERVRYRDRWLVIVLVKNPTGLNEVVRMLASAHTGAPVLILINDLDADGRDVSWLWDADLEPLAWTGAPVFAGGLRGPDMALRLKYAGLPEGQLHPLGDLPDALDAFVNELVPGQTGYVLPTYTAMLALRQTLARRGVAPVFWQQ